MDKVKLGGVVVTTIIADIFAAVTGWLGILAIPVYALVACNILDYITGLMAAKYRNQTINSDTGVRGIFKKVGMWILVCVGAMVDTLINYSVNVAGFHIAIPFIFAFAIALWLDFNELISIVENVKDMGVKLPKFLLPLLKNIKKKVDDTASSATKKTEVKNE